MHARRQLAEQRQFEALTLPRFELQNNPQEQHDQQNQNSKQKKNHGGSNVGKKERSTAQNKKGYPERNALPGMKTHEAVTPKCRQK